MQDYLCFVYARLVQANLPVPAPPRDADLNGNGLPDVQEPRLWNFDEEVGYIPVGTTVVNGDAYILTPAAVGKTGGLYRTIPVLPEQVPWEFSFDFAIAPGSSIPADGLAFSCDPFLTLVAGGGMGLPPNLDGGFAVVIDTYGNGVARPPELQIRQGDQSVATTYGEANVVAKVSSQPGLRSPQWQKARIRYDGQTIESQVGSVVLNAPFQVTAPFCFIKLVAATGGFFSEHRIRNPVFIPLFEGVARSRAAVPFAGDPPSVHILLPHPSPTGF